jgi:hypothetical protein
MSVDDGSKKKKINSRVLGKVYIIKDDGVKYWLQIKGDAVKFVRDWSLSSSSSCSSEYLEPTTWYFVGVVFHRPFRFIICNKEGNPIFWYGEDKGLSMNYGKSLPVTTVAFNDNNSMTMYIGGQQLPFQVYWESETEPVFDVPEIQGQRPYFNWYRIGFWFALFITLIILIILLFIAINGIDQQKNLMSNWFQATNSSNG